METETKNAIIENVEITKADHGLLSAWLYLKYESGGQGFGGFALYLPKSFTNHELKSPAGHFIFRCLEIADVSNWSEMAGKAIRVIANNSKIFAIGHIIKDDWFQPDRDFSKEENK